jgi:hypothetical protein
MKIHFTPPERLLIYRLFAYLTEREGRNRDRRRKLGKIVNRFWGAAPMTNLKREEATLVFVVCSHALAQDEKSEHPNRGVFQSIVDKLVAPLAKEARTDEITGFRGPDAL